MRKYLAPIGICLALGLAIAGAQTINKAVQLSQDASGAFGIDTNNNIYFPGHQLTTGPGTPAVTAGTCGSGSPSVTGTDTAGTITAGTGTVTCSLVFSQAYLATPYCMAASQTAVATPISYVPTTTRLLITQVGTSGNLLSYACTGSK